MTDQKMNLIWDWTSQLPIPHLSFLLRNILPMRHCSQLDLEVIEGQVQNKLSGLLSQNPSLKCLITGSAFENTCIPDVIDNQETNSARSLDELVVFLVHTDKEVAPKTQIVKVCDKIMAKRLPETDFIKLYQPEDSSLGGEETTADLDKIFSAYHKDPVTDLGISYNNTVPNSKTVMVLPHPEWPGEAMEWINRERKMGWPTDEVIRTVKSAGCHLVFSPGEGDTKGRWRYSFVKAEQILFESLTSVQLHCFRILKAMHHFFLTGPEIFTINDLKMLFLWACERVPAVQWTEDNLGKCVLYLLDEILMSTAEQSLKHYFMPDIDLINDKDDDTFFAFGLKITDLRSEPLRFLYQMNKFNFQPRSMSLKKLFDPLFGEIETLAEDIKLNDFLKVLFLVTKNLATAYFDVEQAENAMKTYEDLRDFLTNFGCFKMPSGMEFVRSQVEGGQLGGVKNTIMGYEYLCSSGCGSNYSSLYGNLGCMYASYAYQTTDEKERNQRLSKADESFQMAIAAALGEGITCKPATWTDYGNFLCITGRHVEAADILQAVIETEESNQNPEDGNGYDENEFNTVDANIQREIESRGAFNIPSFIYSFYLLIMHEENISNAETLLERFSKACSRFFHNKEKGAASYALLGYAFMKLEKYEKAKEAFEKVLQIDPACLTALENKNECEAFLLSLSISDDPEPLDVD